MEGSERNSGMARNRHDETWHRLHERTNGIDAVGTPRSTDSSPRKLRGFRPESPPWRNGRRERRDRHQGGDGGSRSPYTSREGSRPSTPSEVKFEGDHAAFVTG